MKAAEIAVVDGGLAVKGVERERPVPGPGEVQVAVRAAGVIPTELVWYPSTHTKEGTARERAIPGHEFAGTIAAVGEGVEGYRVGDAVYGMNDWFAEGAMAEFCVTTPAQIAPMPKGMTYEEAASVPISALTAWQGVVERGGLRAGERILIQGAGGAVGLYAVQLARGQGAFVVATASAVDRGLLKELGADAVIDYKTERFEDVDEAFDVVFDTVGGDVLERSFDVLKQGGRVVTIAAAAEGVTDERVKKAFFIVEPSHEQLVTIAGMLEEKKLVPFVKAVVPLGDAEAAFGNSLSKTEARGKVVVTIPWASSVRS